MEEFYQIRNIGLHTAMLYLVYVFISKRWLLSINKPTAPNPDAVIILITCMMLVASNSTVVFSMMVGVLFMTTVGAGIRRFHLIDSDYNDLGWILTGMIYVTLVCNAFVMCFK